MSKRSRTIVEVGCGANQRKRTSVTRSDRGTDGRKKRVLVGV